MMVRNQVMDHGTKFTLMIKLPDGRWHMGIKELERDSNGEGIPITEEDYSTLFNKVLAIVMEMPLPDVGQT